MTSNPNKFIRLLKSRKFWAAIAALVLVIIQAFIPDFPLDEEQVTKVGVVLVSYIIGTAIEER